MHQDLLEENKRLTLEHSSLMMRHARLQYELGPDNPDTTYMARKMQSKEDELWIVRQELKKLGR